MFSFVLNEAMTNYVAFFNLHCVNVLIRLMALPNMNTELGCDTKGFVEVGTNCVLLVLHFRTLLYHTPYLQYVNYGL